MTANVQAISIIISKLSKIIEYILFGCNEISEELNTLLFKSVQTFIRQTCRFNN
jgi:hypothetical protein